MAAFIGGLKMGVNVSLIEGVPSMYPGVSLIATIIPHLSPGTRRPTARLIRPGR